MQPAFAQIAEPAENAPLVSEARQALPGFFLFGMLMSSIGAFLPAWGIHLSGDSMIAGHYFLGLGLGVLISIQAGRTLLSHKGVRWVLIAACLTACLGFLELGFSGPPASAYWRIPGIVLIGLAGGLLNAAVFQAIAPLYQHDPSSTVTLAGALFGLGCLVTALLVAGTYYVYTFASILFFFAVVPGLFALVYSKYGLRDQRAVQPIPLRAVLRDFKHPVALLFGLLLLFQCGNEWAMAGWLPVILIRRLGISPEASLFLLAFYFACLMLGRMAAQVLLKIVNQRLLLVLSISIALLGFVILASTTNRFGAGTAILFIGAGYASIYPLAITRAGSAFSAYHPAFYHGILTIAFTGGMLAPAMLGYASQVWDVQGAILIPLLGSCLVFLLVLSIMLAAKLSGWEAGGKA